MSVKEMIKNEIENVPEEILVEIFDFIQFLIYKQEKESLASFTQKLSEKSFEKVWDNEEDAIYDNL